VYGKQDTNKRLLLQISAINDTLYYSILQCSRSYFYFYSSDYTTVIMKFLLVVTTLLLVVGTATAFQLPSSHSQIQTPKSHPSITITTITSTTTSTTALHMDDSPTLDIPAGETSRQYRRTVYTHDDW
jgi:hypothetical protein